MGAEDIVIPIIIFTAIVVIVFLVLRYRAERFRVEAQGGDDYRRLAEEAVKAQRALVEETQRMNGTLREIERLLREV